jgi:hypothetical protein
MAQKLGVERLDQRKKLKARQEAILPGGRGRRGEGGTD